MAFYHRIPLACNQLRVRSPSLSPYKACMARSTSHRGYATLLSACGPNCSFLAPCLIPRPPGVSMPLLSEAHRRYSIAHRLTLRQAGQLGEVILQSQAWCRRLNHLGLSTTIEIRKEDQRGPVNSMALDPEEERYLLVGAGDSSIGLYDLEEGTRDPHEADGPFQVSSMKVASKQTDAQSGGAQQCHTYAVTAVRWYPIDTGLFISGSTDGTVKAWDTNEFRAVGSFQLGTKVHAAALSPVASKHTLIAVATEDRRVRLCDLTSGGSSHVLMGHTEAVLSVAWSPRDEHILATGSKDLTVRLWDVRRSGATACLMSFDQHLDYTGRREGLQGLPSQLAKAHDGVVVSLAFTPDGNWLLTAGTDKRMRLWNVTSGYNSLTKFLETRNTRPFGWDITVAQPGNGSTARVFYPNGSSGDVLVYPVHGGNGRPCQVLKGHLDSVYSVVYRESKQQVISSGADSLVLVHDRSQKDAEEAARLDVELEGGGGGRKRSRQSAEWSDQEGDDDEEEEEEKQDGGGGRGGGGRRGGFVPPIVNALFGGGGSRSSAGGSSSGMASGGGIRR